MILLATFLLAGATSCLVWLAMRTTFQAPGLQRTNYRGAPVPVGAGIVLVVALLVIEAGAALVGWEVYTDGYASRVYATVLATGFCLLGLFDDLAAEGDDRGFRGHLLAMAKGRLTTGGLKVVGGGLLAIVVVHLNQVEAIDELLIGGALIALAANLGNLLDRAPGRCTKVALVAGAVLVAAAAASDRPWLVGPVAILGAGAGLLAFDLREALMLGDAGSNVLGAAVGLGVVLTTGLAVQLVVLAVLVGLNLLSERVSFSRVIDATTPLRWFDRLGGRRPA
ncbi:MAG: hypothetical protein KDA98_08980 [Acidimicrobiales bacterium]|nr:hypothetical protein [Acidimicrobiales bacterium]